jgi:hypothetical protein
MWLRVVLAQLRALNKVVRLLLALSLGRKHSR